MGTTGAPLNDLASDAGIGFVSWAIDLGITASFFACAVASINAAARITMTMSEEGILGAALGATHEDHRTPHVAIAVLSPLLFVVPAAIVVSGKDTLEALAYVGTVGTFGFMVAYALCSIAAPVWLSLSRAAVAVQRAALDLRRADGARCGLVRRRPPGAATGRRGAAGAVSTHGRRRCRPCPPWRSTPPRPASTPSA
jgi:hypothetical protein